MIYGQKYHPHLNQLSITEPVVTSQHIKKWTLLLQNGDTMVDVVRKEIKSLKAQYEVVDTGASIADPNEVDRYKLRSLLSSGEQWLEKFITVHPETLELKHEAALMAPTEHPVLITGESGTGKELIAKAMIWNRKEGRTCAVNCAGFPESLIESELFGHIKGSFTGAESSKKGLLEEATNGVMFLDEIGDMPLHMQAKLLRAMQEKVIRPVGGNKDVPINCKFVCATHRDLTKMVEEETFRKDLFARISTLELYILPLRNRMCDLIPITESIKNSEKFLEKHGEDLQNGKLSTVLNVRSLERYVIRYNVIGKI